MHDDRHVGTGSLVLVTALAPMAWGTTYAVTTELLPAGRPLLAATLRALPAGVALVAVTRLRPPAGWWRRIAVLGTLNIGAFFALLFVAADRLPGGVAATLGAVQPLVVAGLGAVVLGERVQRRTLVAGAMGIVGVALLVLRSDAALDPVGVAAGLAGTATMATGVVLTKRWGRPVPLLAMTGWQLIAGGLVVAPVMLAVEGAPPALTATNLAGNLWLAAVGTALAYSVWFRGIERLPVQRVSLLGLLSPLVATTVGWLVLHQTLSVGQVLGAVTVLAGLRIGQGRLRTLRPAGQRVTGVLREPRAGSNDRVAVKNSTAPAAPTTAATAGRLSASVPAATKWKVASQKSG